MVCNLSALRFSRVQSLAFSLFSEMSISSLTQITLTFSILRLPSPLKKPSRSRLISGWSWIASREYGGITPSLYFPVNRPNHAHQPTPHHIPSSVRIIRLRVLRYKQIERMSYRMLTATKRKCPFQTFDTLAGIPFRLVHG